MESSDSEGETVKYIRKEKTDILETHSTLEEEFPANHSTTSRGRFPRGRGGFLRGGGGGGGGRGRGNKRGGGRVSNLTEGRGVPSVEIEENKSNIIEENKDAVGWGEEDDIEQRVVAAILKEEESKFQEKMGIGGNVHLFDGSAKWSDDEEDESDKINSKLNDLVENQNEQGFWKVQKNLGLITRRNLSYFQETMPKTFQDQAEILWVTGLVLFYLESFHPEKFTTWRLMFRRGKDFLDERGINYDQMKADCKIFFYGASRKPENSMKMQKDCMKCQSPLIFLMSIGGGNNRQRYKCDECGCTGLKNGQVFQCNGCQFALCEECNNEEKIKCGFCKSGTLLIGKGVKKECSVCMEKIIDDKTYLYSCVEPVCKFIMCLGCKAIR